MRKPEKRLQIRRGQTQAKVLPIGAVQFKDVPIGDYFYLTEKHTHRLTWIKTHAWGGQYSDWNNDSGFPDQSFPQDYPVFVV